MPIIWEATHLAKQDGIEPPSDFLTWSLLTIAFRFVKGIITLTTLAFPCHLHYYQFSILREGVALVLLGGVLGYHTTLLPKLPNRIIVRKCYLSYSGLLDRLSYLLCCNLLTEASALSTYQPFTCAVALSFVTILILRYYNGLGMLSDYYQPAINELCPI